MVTMVEFFDFKTKKKFKTSKFTIIRTGGRLMAKGKTPSGRTVTVFLKKDFKR